MPTPPNWFGKLVVVVTRVSWNQQPVVLQLYSISVTQSCLGCCEVFGCDISGFSLLIETFLLYIVWNYLQDCEVLKEDYQNVNVKCFPVLCVSFDFSCLSCFSWFWIAEKIIVIALKYNIIIVTLTFKLSTDSKDLYHRYKVSVTKLQTRWFTHVSTSPHLHHEVLQEVQEGLDWQVQVQEVSQVVQQQNYSRGGERVALPTCW